MSRRFRLILFLAGLLILAVSLAALAFALPAAESVRIQATLSPSLMVPP